MRSVRTENLQKHIEEQKCLEPFVPGGLTLPTPPEGQDKVFLRFKKHGFKLTMPLVVYADYEAFQDAFDIQQGEQTKKVGEMTGTASFAFYAHSEIIDIPPELRLVLRRENAEDLIDKLMLLVDWLHGLEDKEIDMTDADEINFQQAVKCYLCDKPFFNNAADNTALVRWMNKNLETWLESRPGRRESSFLTAKGNLAKAAKVHCAEDCRNIHGINKEIAGFLKQHVPDEVWNDASSRNKEREHCHYTGRYRGAACHHCNMSRQAGEAAEGDPDLLPQRRGL